MAGAKFELRGWKYTALRETSSGCETQMVLGFYCGTHRMSHWWEYKIWLDLFDNIDLRKGLRYQQRLRKGLRKRLLLKYQGQLVQRPGKGRRHQDIKLGGILLIESRRDFGLRQEWWKPIQVRCLGQHGAPETAVCEMVRPVNECTSLK